METRTDTVADRTWTKEKGTEEDVEETEDPVHTQVYKLLPGPTTSSENSSTSVRCCRLHPKTDRGTRDLGRTSKVEQGRKGLRCRPKEGSGSKDRSSVVVVRVCYLISPTDGSRVVTYPV